MDKVIVVDGEIYFVMSQEDLYTIHDAIEKGHREKALAVVYTYLREQN